MSFHRGEPGIFADTASPIVAPFTPFEKACELRVVGKRREGRHRHAHPLLGRPADLHEGCRVQLEELEQRARQTAFLVPGLEIVIRDERARASADVETSFRFDGGISEFVEFLAPDAAVTDTWRLTGIGHLHRDRARCCSRPAHMVPTEVERECEVDIALRWGTGYETVVPLASSTSSRRPRAARTSRASSRGCMKVLRAQVEQNARRLKVGNDKLEKDDILAGLTAVLTVRLPEPQFEGQTKEVLGTPAVRQIVAQRRHARARGALHLDQARRQEPDRAAARQGRRRDEGAHLGARPQGDAAAQERARVLVAAGEARRLPHRTTSAQSELFIVEGDSALGTAKLARNSEYQALLPIRGKILNVQKASVSDMLVERRVRLDHPGDRRRLGPHRSTSTRPATARSS